MLLFVGCAKNSDEVEEEKIVLTVLAGQSTSDAGIEDMIDEWMSEKFPNVTLEWECVDWGEKFAVQMRSRIAAGETPDIMIGKAQDVHNYAKTGNLGEISDACVGKISKEAIEIVEVDDIIYGIPYTAWYQGVVYNKNIFKTYDLTPPTTIEELEEIVEVLEENDIVAFAGHYQESWKVANTMMQYMMNEIFSENENWGDEFREGKQSFQESEKIKFCLKQQKYLLQHSWDDALFINQFESDSRFTKGEAAMYLTGSWSMQFAHEYGSEVEFGIFPYPNEMGNAKLIRETNMTFMKAKDSEHSELIDEIFLALLSDEELTQEIVEFTQSSTVVEGMDSESVNVLKKDIELYEAEENVIDVTIGNAQLQWDFQNNFAQQALQWIKGEKTMENILMYADENRAASIYVED